MYDVNKVELWPYLRTSSGYEPMISEDFFTRFPPMKGDLFSFPGELRIFRVMDRHWMHAVSSKIDVDGHHRSILVLLMEEAERGLFDE